jgi:RNA polymerase sigma-70 factor (ECF subfamily)
MDLQPTDLRLASTGFDDVWRNDRGHLLRLAARLLGDQAEAEDVIQDAFDRLTRVDLAEIDDVRGWLAVVVRHLCLDRLRSAYVRRESVSDADFVDASTTLQGERDVDPADRVTLDDQIQAALAVVLDRLSPAERTAFVLHDVFGFPFAAVGEIVGRSPAACRQLASRARRSVRAGDGVGRSDDVALTSHRRVVEQFIAACKGGDITELMATLDPEIDGHATLLGFGPLPGAEGRPAIARTLLGLFGPSTDAVLVPVSVECDGGMIAFVHHRLAIVRFTEADGLIRHIHAVVVPSSGSGGYGNP